MATLYHIFPLILFLIFIVKIRIVIFIIEINVLNLYVFKINFTHHFTQNLINFLITEPKLKSSLYVLCKLYLIYFRYLFYLNIWYINIL